MTDVLRLPLIPPEVDLRDFGFMPLDVLRLRDSDLAALATGDEFKAAVLLWCAAWHQVPAASLPKEDRLLARFSGAGPTWKKVRAEALRGFVECSDGRLYHPVIAEKAAESWAKKLAQRERTRAATEAREARRRAEQASRDVERNVTRNGPRDEQRDVERNVHQGTGTGTGTVKGQGQGDLTATAQALPPPTPPVDPMPDLPDKPTEIVHIANFLTRQGFDPVQVHNVKTRLSLKAWADAGVTWAVISTAIDSARQRLGGALPASPRYLIPLIQTLMAAGDEPDADRIARLEKQIFGEEHIDAEA